MPKKRNKPGSRRVEKKIVIYCEGRKDKSEFSYLYRLIKRYRFPGEKVEVVVKDSRSNTGKELVQQAKNDRESKDDIMWVVYDKDGYTKHAETFDAAKRSNIKIAFNSISFEFWILMHFQYTCKSFLKSDDVIKHLIDNGFIEYSKDMVDLFDHIKDKLDIAKVNGKKVRDCQVSSSEKGKPVYEMNPYTNMHELVDEIESFKL